MKTKNIFKMKSKDLIYLAIILVTMGVILINLLTIGSIGIVFIALGGLCFILGMRTKKLEDEIRKIEE